MIFNLILSISITHLIVYSAISNRFKGLLEASWEDDTPQSKLFNCSQCIGFWVGLIIFLLSGWGLQSILWGFISSWVNTIIEKIVDRI